MASFRRLPASLGPAADQGLLSLITILVVVYSSHFLNPVDGAAAVLILSVVLVGAALVQAGYLDPSLMPHSRPYDTVVAGVLVLALPLLSVVGGSVMLLLGSFSWHAIVAAVVMGAGYLIVDLTRWRGYRQGRAGTWCVAAFAGSAAGSLLLFQPTSLTGVLLAIGVPGLVVGSVILWGSSERPRRSRPSTPHPTLVADYILSMGAVSLFPAVATGVVGPVLAGSLRSAQALLGPVNLLIAATRVPVLRGAHPLRATVASCLASLIVLACAAILPAEVYALMVGEQAAAVKSILIVLGVQLVIMSMYFSLQYAYRREGWARAILVVRALGALTTFAAAAVLVGSIGSIGIAWSLVAGSVANLVGTAIVWLLQRRGPALDTAA